MALLAWRNLFHDTIRLIVTLTGVVFAVMLATVQLGLFVGFTVATTDIIDHARADLWIVSKNVAYLEGAVAFPERTLYQVLATPGVAQARRYIVQFGQWEAPNGAGQNVLLVGFQPESSLGQPWNISAGRIEDVKTSGTVMVDELYKHKLGVTHLGQRVEIRGRRARVVGFTRGIRTFTTAPAVFTSFKNAQEYADLQEDHVLYILVQAAPHVDVQMLKHALQRRLSDVDVYTTAEWSRTQRTYWMIETGAGITVLLSALLGVLVGGVVVTQTIYAATVDHLREYATLKAMGASNGYIYRVIIVQAAISACIGYVVGTAISLVAAILSQQSTTAIIIPWPLLLGIFGLTLLMCVGASVVSITKVTRLDPAMVFKN